MVTSFEGHSRGFLDGGVQAVVVDQQATVYVQDASVVGAQEESVRSVQRSFQVTVEGEPEIGVASPHREGNRRDRPGLHRWTRGHRVGRNERAFDVADGQTGRQIALGDPRRKAHVLPHDRVHDLARRLLRMKGLHHQRSGPVDANWLGVARRTERRQRAVQCVMDLCTGFGTGEFDVAGTVPAHVRIGRLIRVDPVETQASDLGCGQTSVASPIAGAVSQQDVIAHELNGRVAVPAFGIAFDGLHFFPRSTFVPRNRQVERRPHAPASVRRSRIVPHEQQVAGGRDSLDRGG